MQKTVAWLGLDAHAKFSLLALMDDQGNRRRHWRFPTSEPQLIKHLKQVPAATKHLAYLHRLVTLKKVWQSPS